MTRMARKTKAADRLSAPIAARGRGEGAQPPPQRAIRPRLRAAAAARAPRCAAMAEVRAACARPWTKAMTSRASISCLAVEEGASARSCLGFARSPPAAILLPATVERIVLKMAQEKLSAAALARHLGFSTKEPSLERRASPRCALRLALVERSRPGLRSRRR